MIHTVFFWLRPELSDAERGTFEAELARLPAIPYVVQGHVSKPAATAERPVTDHSFDYSLILEFATMEDHDRYQNDDPDHDRFVANCKPLFERVVVYDSEPFG